MKTNKGKIDNHIPKFSKVYKISVGLSALALLSGCATVFCGSEAEVKFESTPSGADVYASTPDNQSGIYLGRTPLTADVPRETRTIILRKPGYEEMRVHSGRKFSFFPMIIDALWWPTLIVDAYTGSCYSLKESHNVTLQKK